MKWQTDIEVEVLDALDGDLRGDAGKVQQVTLTPSTTAPVQLTEQHRWEYHNREETWSILVTEDSVILQTADSGPCRSVIPFHADHRFRCIPITLE